MYLELDSNDVITSIGTAQIAEADQVDGYTYTADVEIAGMVPGGTYVGTTYTAPTVTEAMKNYAWKAALSDLVGADSNDIDSKDATWKKCVYHGSRDNMDSDCWDSITGLYSE
jgi:hypothetical protein